VRAAHRAFIGTKKYGGRFLDRRIDTAKKKSTTLDDVDLGRHVGSDFEANFLLAYLRLVPDLHWVFPP
jgi:hypothetical protein